ncbi:MAG: hypothetical protein GX096_14660 [Clostridiales bacterium]|nr:hypothetical protein [Clostridiales bacterium]
MQKRIFRGVLLLTIVSALLVGVLSSVENYLLSERQLKEQLTQELTILSSLHEEQADKASFISLLDKLDVQNRVTWIAADGTVLFDNQGRAKTMENHAYREEIITAKNDGFGYVKRYSNTLLEEQLYCAKALTDESYLRIAATQRTIGGQLKHMSWVLVLGITVIVVGAGLLSRAWTRNLVKPINEIDLENPLNNHVYDELSPILRRMQEQNGKIDIQIKEITDRRNELDTIIKHMNEGLLILDHHKHVLMMNDSAQRILHAPQAVDGKTGIASYNRSQVLLDAVDAAFQEGSSFSEMKVGVREYMLTASVVRPNAGLVLLLQDVTEKNQAEAGRRRFTANVSHELRTPLTTISGYAELMKTGMTKAEDIPEFSAKIHKESQRLLQLVEDIIHLSMLDEGFVAGRMTTVDLFAIAKQAAEENAATAINRDVKLVVDGESANIQGDFALIDRMLRNIIENGIKYNRAQGKVHVKVSSRDGKAAVVVADTGIGIPQGHIDRIFERFYRVDGSRSKLTGGTGLGLSIVKHGAEYHHAKINLTSEEGKGTTFEIIFPMNAEGLTK